MSEGLYFKQVGGQSCRIPCHLELPELLTPAPVEF